MANKRIKRKKRKQSVLVYPENCCPDWMTINEVLKLYKSQGIVLYSTVDEIPGAKPFIVPSKNTKFITLKVAIPIN